jgi:PEP-CTERM motif
MRTLLALAAWAISSMALAAPITFDLRDPAIEAIDEVNSFSLTQDGLTATLSALPATFNQPPVRDLVLNQTASSFGVNVVGTTCGGLEDSALIDGGCLGEAVGVVFDHDVVLNSLKVSNFGSSDVGLVTIGTTTIDILSTGAHSLEDILLPKGNPWSIAWIAGNGFSFDNFTVTPVPEPATLALLGLAFAGMGLARRRKLH